MSKPQLFNFEGNEVRTVVIENEPFFVGKDVTGILGYSNSRDALLKHVDSEDKETLTSQNTTLENIPNRGLISINESGLYGLIMSSKLPNAKKFKRWVTSEVLPAIRKHGAYMTSETIEDLLTNPDNIIKLATQLKTERKGRLIAEQRVGELQPKATYYDQVLANKSLVTITVIAKDYGMSGREMNSLLHDLGVQYRQSGTWLLYSKYQKTGWTQSETRMIPMDDRTEKAVLNTKWTQKGRLGLYELLKKHGYLPMIEQDLVETE